MTSFNSRPFSSCNRSQKHTILSLPLCHCTDNCTRLQVGQTRAFHPHSLHDQTVQTVQTGFSTLHRSRHLDQLIASHAALVALWGMGREGDACAHGITWYGIIIDVIVDIFFVCYFQSIDPAFLPPTRFPRCNLEYLSLSRLNDIFPPNTASPPHHLHQHLFPPHSTCTTLSFVYILRTPQSKSPRTQP
ncbi:hypothetical protein BJY00DRAFT_58303 [Aspergillus carlsbadensis]|nr:hypothetical protein BJY00DRAFT_58303 [Aspergillus carlsbadensis]